MTDVAVIVLSVLTAPARRSEPMSPVATLLLLLGIGAVVYAVHAWRWREVAWCTKCDGKGSFQSTSLILRRPVRRPCPRCTGRGKAPWRKRKLFPDSDK